MFQATFVTYDSLRLIISPCAPQKLLDAFNAEEKRKARVKSAQRSKRGAGSSRTLSLSPMPVHKEQGGSKPMDGRKRKAAGVSHSRPKKHGFDRDLSPEKIIGASKEQGELKLMMKWRGSDHTDLVSAKEANGKCPQVVIRFYQDRIHWVDPVDDE